MHQHTQHPEASTRPTNEEYEDSSVSSTADMEKEMIAANALNEGTTQPYEDPIAEDPHRQHADGSYVEEQTTSGPLRSENGMAGNELEKQTTRRSIRSGKAVSVNNVAAIPNGGTKAWLQVLGAFTLFFNSWGISKYNSIWEKSKRQANSFDSQHLWRLPDLLPIRHPLFFLSFGYLMDRISTGFLAYVYWRTDGTRIRRWIFQSVVERRVVYGCIRLYDDFIGYNILAGHLGSRNLCRSRSWMLVCPVCRYPEYILQHKDCHSNGPCCCWK